MNLKKAELAILKKYDLIVALNEKDKQLLIDAGIDKSSIMRMCSFHGFCQSATYNPDCYQLLFYGAMARKENYLSVIWFIENVMPYLDDKYKLIIAGSNPPDELKKFESERIIITGFVESIIPYFENSLCLVSPLLLGAGIKIKILEALSAGIPVLTNNVGSEGIDLVDGISYLHCESAQDFINAIEELSVNVNLRMKLSKNGRLLVKRDFNVDSTLDMLIGRINEYEK